MSEFSSIVKRQREEIEAFDDPHDYLAYFPNQLFLTVAAAGAYPIFDL